MSTSTVIATPTTRDLPCSFPSIFLSRSSHRSSSTRASLPFFPLFIVTAGYKCRMAENCSTMPPPPKTRWVLHNSSNATTTAYFNSLFHCWLVGGDCWRVPAVATTVGAAPFTPFRYCSSEKWVNLIGSVSFWCCSGETR